ncbi:401aa long hypothetical protein [Pyrococcus horikoshii OT3]|uniref:Uncharacterized protein n=1 Tax=Pyrococcus horikoshii (strain ATCC 700860 / DSM 12428 / JCM 9974 / NBRC 100139 / OT-3) TaxID=70601 RepID=O59558_PYRHO|nr:401aa long hypothetical protein [Pyrococcus horikoshii OT3]
MIMKVLPEDDIESIEDEIRMLLMESLIKIIKESNSVEETKQRIIEWLDLIKESFGIPGDSINQIKKEIEEMKSETIKKRFIGAIKSEREVEIHKIEKVISEHIETSKEYEEYARLVGKIAEDLVLMALAFELYRKRRRYILIPYFRAHKQKRGKRGRPSKGSKYVDVGLIDLDRRNIVLIEIKNWISVNRGFYSIKMYEENDRRKWSESEKDILTFLEEIGKVAGGKKTKRRKKRKSLAFRLFEETIDYINYNFKTLEELNKHSSIGMGKIDILEFLVEFWEQETRDFNERDYEVNEKIMIEMLNGARFLEVSPDVYIEYIEHAHREKPEEKSLFDNGEFRVLRVFLVFSEIERISEELQKQMSEDEVIPLEQSGGLKNPKNVKYWKEAKEAVNKILELIS